MANALNLPVIWHIHESTTAERFVAQVPSAKDIIEDCFVSADRIVFESGATRRLLDEFDTSGNFVTIPGSIEIDAIDEFRQKYDKNSLRRKYGIREDAVVVSLVGTTCARKGQHVFLEAIKQLSVERDLDLDKLFFLMVGGRESPYLDFLRDRIHASGVGNLRLMPECDDIYDFFRLSDIFVCASFQESFPRVVLLAMAFKLGIVSTDVFGISEMVSDGHEGLLIPPGDASRMAECIALLVQDSALRRELGDKAHSKATRLFNNRVQLRKRLDLAKEVVARHV